MKILILNKAKIFSSLWTAARRHVLSIFHYPRGFTAICPLLPPPYPPQFLVSNLPLFFTAMGNCRENPEKEVNFESLCCCKNILFKILRIKQLFVIPQILVIGSILPTFTFFRVYLGGQTTTPAAFATAGGILTG